ncbi:hypothetical protein [Rudaeicoccus suwonensis]|uniref:Cell wall-associated NlpC family hydrolase n=1 Tax=Rudaeicoccus suwonensis TaxID=657409 RepID=A0A561EC10_9MICO|nr:hypothetical protein [Rudaeicoccus suwonensis]TWE13146.1 hypothetical protein BKA23_1975 [Rudaeicoccus suwonensis]
MRTRTAITLASVAAVGCAVAVPAGTAFADGMGSHATHVSTVRTAASSVNGTISRSEVISRAQYWLKTQPPYSETHYAPGPEGKLYRQDCSGSVSMAWHLGTSLTTWQFDPHSSQFAGIDHQISWSDLQPGDALVQNAQYNHIALFVGWADKAHTEPIVIEQYDYGHSQTQRTWNSSYAHEFTPIRYNKISGGGGGGTPTPPPSTGGKYYENVWKSAPSYRAASTASRAGTLNAGRNYFYCQAKGQEMNAEGYHNDWWLKTDDDSGNSGVWVNAIYVSSGTNDGSIPGVPQCAGSTGGGGGHTSPTAKIYKSVWQSASSYTSPTSMKTIGVLHAGSNYFYCQTKGSELNASGYQNNWWLKTDDDSGNSGVWVNAIFVSGGSNNGQIPGIPAC